MTDDKLIAMIERCRRAALWAVYNAVLLPSDKRDFERREAIADFVSAALYALKSSLEVE